MKERKRIHVEDYPLEYGLYTGELYGTEPDGQGKVMRYDGDCYDGQWQDGYFHGKGVYIWADGESYAGDWVEGRRSGRGVYRYANGDVYDGEYRNSACHGKGSLFWADGESYTGDWEEGSRTGRGTYRYASGDVYEGEFLDGQRHGKGTYRWADGETQEGLWENGEYIEGSGATAEPICTKEYRLVRYADACYSGEFRNGQRHGRGKYAWDDGRCYKGQWEKGACNGYGVYRYANGDVYKGGWENNLRHGEGVYIFADGGVRTGRWEKGSYVEGSGSYTAPVRGTEMDYRKLYQWWRYYEGNSPAYNARFRRLRECGNAQEIVRNIIGGNDLSSVRREEADFCMFLLERFVPHGADRELLARCYYLTGQIKKAAGIVAMAIQWDGVQIHLDRRIEPYGGLAMEIMAAHYLKKAMDTCDRKNLCFVSNGVYYDWPYVANYQNIAAMRYLIQASYASAKYDTEQLGGKSLELTNYLEELVDQKRFQELLGQ